MDLDKFRMTLGAKPVGGSSLDHSFDSTLPPVASGFTPINRPTNRGPLEEHKVLCLSTPDETTAVPKRGRKRQASQFTTPPTTIEKARRKLPRLPKKTLNKGSAKDDVFKLSSAFDRFDQAQISTDPVSQQLADKTSKKTQQAASSETKISAVTLNKLASFRYQGEPAKLPVVGAGGFQDQNIIVKSSLHEQNPASTARVRSTHPCTILYDEGDHCIRSKYSDDDSAFDEAINDLLRMRTSNRSSVVTIEDKGSSAPELDFHQDEQALSQLTAVQEPFEPPSSFQIPFDDDSQTSEAYDPQPQHSRPSSIRSLHSIEVDGIAVAVGSRTTIEKYRTSHSRPLPATTTSPFTRPTNEYHVDVIGSDEEINLLDDDVDSDMLDLASYASRETRYNSPIPVPSRPLSPKLQWNPPTEYKPTKSSSASSPIQVSKPKALPQRQPLAEIPTSSNNFPPPAPHRLSFDAEGNALPFARPPFPKPVLDRSPILGLSSSPLLRTCFRIGEALNAASLAAHTNATPLIELYARVTYSRRVGVEQFIQFADLFRSEKPPFLSGSYVGWKGIDLWDCDSKVFLGDVGKGKMARCVGKMKRDGTSKTWKMVVLSIWEATWEDVAFVKGIVCS